MPAAMARTLCRPILAQTLRRISRHPRGGNSLGVRACRPRPGSSSGNLSAAAPRLAPERRVKSLAMILPSFCPEWRWCKGRGLGLVPGLLAKWRPHCGTPITGSERKPRPNMPLPSGAPRMGVTTNRTLSLRDCQVRSISRANTSRVSRAGLVGGGGEFARNYSSTSAARRRLPYSSRTSFCGKQPA
jgi:hypothetical protein